MAIAMLLALAIGSPAHATSFAPMTIEQYTDASTYIVQGRVLEVWTELDAERLLVWTRARVAVDRTLKGPDGPREIVVDSAGGAWGDYSVEVAGRAVFSVDEQVFLFLDQLADGRLVPVGKYLGKYTVRRAPGERESYVRTWHPTPGEVFDARFLPHPADDERVYLADLEQRVEARLAAGWDGQPIPGLAPERLQIINTPAFRRIP